MNIFKGPLTTFEENRATNIKELKKLFPILKAFTDGLTIQQKTHTLKGSSDWENVGLLSTIGVNDPRIEYRIAPESDTLHNKFLVTRTDGKEIPPEAQMFVLRYDKDIHAQRALRTYANSVKEENPILAKQLLSQLGTTEKLIGWISIKDRLPEQPLEMEVLGYNPDWIDEDFNPDGTRLCCCIDNLYWVSTAWCSAHDCYISSDSDTPTHWIPLPSTNIE